MQRRRNVAWCGGAVTVGLALWLAAILVRAGEPPASGGMGRPPWQRLLTGDDARKAEDLERQIEQLWTRGQFAEAVPVAEQIRALRSRVQGEDHWQAADAGRRVETLRLLAGKPADQRREVAALPDRARAADALRAKGRYRDEEPLRQQILTMTRAALGEEHPATAAAYNNLAECQYAQGRYAEAERGFERALPLYRKALGEEHPDTATAYSNLALCQHAQGRYGPAEQSLTQAAAAFRASRLRVAPGVATRAALASKLSPLYELAAILARNGKPGLAWQRFEEGLGRGLGDAWAVRSQRTPDEERRHTELLARLDYLDRRLQAVAATPAGPPQDRQRQDLLAQQRQALDALHALAAQLDRKYGVNEGRVVTLEQAQARLPADVALLGWVDMPGHPKAADPNGEHWAVVVRARGEPAWVRLPGGSPGSSWTKEDDRLPQQLVAALRQRPGAGAADAAALARRLARQRLEPLAALLDGHDGLPAVRHLVVLPSEQMDGIPLEVLSDRYTVSRAPSATFYTHLRGLPRSAGHGLVAVADPRFTRPQTAPAPLPPGGVLLTVVVPGGNAAQAGLRPGDVLLRYADAPLTRSADLKTRPDTGDPKATIAVEVWRDGQTLTRSVRPGKLGVLAADEPAPVALAGQRQFDRLLASRGPDGHGWPPLPGTRAEAEALRRLFEAKGAAVTLLTDADASEPRLAELARSGALGRARYLHLATHGTFDPRFPLQSAVILAQHLPPGPAPFGRQYFNGELTAAEVLDNWKLDAELVTLSACETALGKQERGEGFLGFAQAALLAGARSVCLSLWKVDDTATALLMERFYQNLLGQREGLKAPLGKAAALAEAKAWLRTLSRDEALKRAAALTQGAKRGKGRPGQPRLPEVPAAAAASAPYAHPYYWAAFILVGDPD